MRGPRGIRPAVPFMPTSPLNPAGIRMEPPPSPPLANVTSPPATAAALPPDEPPAVCDGRHGFPVTPLSFETLTLSPPNSLAVVCPTGLTPPAMERSMANEVWSPTWSFSATDASVYGQPANGSSSFTPKGTPPSGSRTSASAATARARFSSTWLKALSSLAPMADSVASTSSFGDRSPERNASTSETASPSHGVSVMTSVSRQRRARRQSFRRGRSCSAALLPAELPRCAPGAERLPRSH